MRPFGYTIVVTIAILIFFNAIMVWNLLEVRSDLRDFKQETVAEIEVIKERIGDIEYRVHKLEHPAYEKG